MATNYLITRKRSLGAGLSIADETGTPRFEVRGRFGFSKNLTMTDAAGAPVAVITGRPFSSRFEISSGSGRATVRPASFSSRRFEIDSAAGQLQARGNFSGRTYAVARAKAQVAAEVPPAGAAGRG